MNKHCHNSSNSSGFTLVELVVVASLLALMSAILYGTISGILRGKKMIEAQREPSRIAQNVLERMRKELFSRALIGLSREEDPDDPFGAKKAAPFMLGEDKRSGDRDTDTLRFVTSNPSRTGGIGVANYGLVEVTYRLEEAKTDTRSRREKEFVLVRQERPAKIDDKDIIKNRQYAMIVAEKISSLNFRYYDEGKWQNSWEEDSMNADQVKMPEAIEITIEVITSGEAVEAFTTAIAISPLKKR